METARRVLESFHKPQHAVAAKTVAIPFTEHVNRSRSSRRRLYRLNVVHGFAQRPRPNRPFLLYTRIRQLLISKRIVYVRISTFLYARSALLENIISRCYTKRCVQKVSGLFESHVNGASHKAIRFASLVSVTLTVHICVCRFPMKLSLGFVFGDCGINRKEKRLTSFFRTLETIYSSTTVMGEPLLAEKFNISLSSLKWKTQCSPAFRKVR